MQELLGHKTLTMTMQLYAKVRPQNKRQAVARLSYGEGVTAPAHLVEFPASAAEPVADWCPNCTGAVPAAGYSSTCAGAVTPSP